MYFSFFFSKQKTAYDIRISDWSSDVCSSDLHLFDADRFDADWLSLRAPADEAARSSDLTGRFGEALLRRGGGAGRIFDLGRATGRSAERRVGNECVRKWCATWSPYLSMQSIPTLVIYVTNGSHLHKNY